MKRNTKFIFILSFISLLIICISSYYIFFNQVVFYKPFRIEFQGINIIEFSKIKCVGYSPYGKEFHFSGNKVAYSIISPAYVHCKEITLTIPDDIYNNIKMVTYFSGNEKQIINLYNNKATIINNPINRGQSFLLFNLSDIYTPDISIIGLYLSTISWAGKYFSVVFLILFLISITLYILRLDFYKSTIDKAFQSMSIKYTLFINKKYNRLIIIFLLFSILSYFYFDMSSFKGAKMDMNDMAYHSAGINFANGHGISRFGTIEPIETYGFTVFRNNLEFHYRFFTRFAGIYYYYNAPAYGLFLGIVYFLSDSNIFLAKAIQLFMLLIVASCLPLLGYRLWQGSGFLCGLLASLIFINTFYFYADRMDAQVLFIFLIFFSVYTYVIFLYKKKYFWLIITALITALACLTKVSVIIYPILIAIYFIYYFVKKKERKLFYYFIVFISCFLFPVLIWSWYATTHKNTELFGEITSEKISYELFDSPLTHKDSTFLNSVYEKKPFSNRVNIYVSMDGYKMTYEDYNKAGADIILPSVFNTDFIFITSQNKNNSLFFFHNEYITQNSTYNARWLNDTNSFYLNDKLKNSPDWLRVLNFYVHNPAQFIILPLYKLYKSFGKNSYLQIFMLCFVLNTILHILLKNKLFLNKYLKLLLFFSINYLLLIPIINTPHPLMFYIIFFIFLCSLIFAFYKKRFTFLEIPSAFILITASQFLLTILISGNERYTEMLDFIFILSSIFAIYYLNKVWIFTKTPDKNITLL